MAHWSSLAVGPEVRQAGARWVEVPVGQAHVDDNLVTAPANPISSVGRVLPAVPRQENRNHSVNRPMPRRLQFYTPTPAGGISAACARPGIYAGY